MLTYKFEDWRKRIAPKTLRDYPCKGCIFGNEDCDSKCKNYDNYREWWIRWSESIKSNYPCTECIVDSTCTLFCPEYETWIKPRLRELPGSLFHRLYTKEETKFKIVDSQYEYKPLILDMPWLKPHPLFPDLSWRPPVNDE